MRQSLRLVSLNPLRSLDIPGVVAIKADHWLTRRQDIMEADWVLFPEYWQVNPLVYAWKRPIFPSAATWHLGHDKVEMTRAFQAVCPEHVLRTAILPATDSAVEQILDEWSLPVVAKVARSSMGEGVAMLSSRAELVAWARANPVLYVQEKLELDRDLRVVWVGDRVVAAYWRVGREGSLHHNVARGGTVDWEGVPAAPLALVERVATALGVDHAGFDLAQVDGHWYLLEFNVLMGTSALDARGIALGPLIYDHLWRRSRPPLDGAPPVVRQAG